MADPLRARRRPRRTVPSGCARTAPSPAPCQISMRGSSNGEAEPLRETELIVREKSQAFARTEPDKLADVSNAISASELRKAAVDGDLAGGHEAAVRRREKGSRRPDLRRIAHALERSHGAVGLQALFA